MNETELMVECKVQLNSHLLKDDGKLVMAAQDKPHVRNYYQAVLQTCPT